MRLTRKLLATFLALRLLAQRADEAKAAAESRELFEGAAAHQLAYLEDTSPRRVVTGSRRSGKTEGFVIELVAVAAAGGRALYLSLTQDLAEETIWERLLERLARLKLTFFANISKRRIRLAGGGLIKLGGCATKKEIDKHRGKAWALVIIDECGAQSSKLLKYTVEDSIGPTLGDYEGRLVMGGTPAPALSGYWCAQAGPPDMRSADCPRYEWTIADNPFFAGRVERVLANALEDNDWEETNTTYRREWLGKWEQDDSTLVYPFRQAINGIAALPERTAKGYPVNPSRWQQVIGVDVGTTEEAMAIVVLACHPAVKGEFMVHAEAHTAMGVDALVARLRALLKRFPRAMIAIDSTSIGSPYAMELASAGLPVLAAVKSAKATAIRVLHDRVVSGRFKLLNVPSIDGVRKEWRSLGWDEDHLQHHPDQADHYSDATLYALRELRHYYTREDLEKPANTDPRRDWEEDDDPDPVGVVHRLRLAWSWVVGEAPLVVGVEQLGQGCLAGRDIALVRLALAA